MAWIAITQALPVIAMAELRDWCRISGEAEDETLVALLLSAQEMLEAQTGRVFGERHFRLTSDSPWPDCQLWAQRTPLIEIENVRFYARDGAEHLIAGDDGIIRIERDTGLILLAPDLCRQAVNGLEVELSAGYAQETVPHALRHALKICVATGYEMRGVGGEDLLLVPNGVRELVRPYRRMGL